MSDEGSKNRVRRSERIMSVRRPKISTRRSKRLNELLSTTTPLEKDALPENANKNDQFRTEGQSNKESNSVEVGSLFSDVSVSPIVILERLKLQEKTTISVEGLVTERRKSLRLFKKFCSEPATEENIQNISKNTSNCTKSDGKNRSKIERKSTSNVHDTKSVSSDSEILNMTDRRLRSSARRSDRVSRSSSRNILKEDVLTKSSSKSKQLNTKRQANYKKRNSVEIDSLPEDGIIPSDFEAKLTRKSLKRKDISFESFNESIAIRRKSSRSCKKVCLDLETDAQAKKHTKSDKKISNEREKKSKVHTSDSAVLLNTLVECSVISEDTPLDDLLFVTSSRKKKYRDVTESSGICSAHSSFMSTFSTPVQKSKCSSLKGISWNDLTETDGSFKIPKTKRPRKTTLKHKRLVLSELNKRNLDHEDDILENINLTPFKVCDVDNESEISWNMATPQCGFKVSPLLPKRTPVFRDCFSPSEFRISRKKAEEYMYRNSQLKNICSSPEIAQSKEPAKKIDVMERLSALLQKRKKIDRSLVDDLTSDEERDDDYYSEEESIQNY